MGDEQKKFLSILVLCAIIFFGGEFLIQKWRGPQEVKPAPTVETSLNHSTPATKDDFDTERSGKGKREDRVLSREEALEGPRVTIQAPQLKGSLNLRGAQFDDLFLCAYHETPSPQSPAIVLLSPQKTAKAYSASFLWQSKTRDFFPLPDENTLWKANQEVLTPESPVTLTWENGQGLLFQQVIRMDKDYLFSITHTITNKAQKPFHLGLSGVITRTVPQDMPSNFLLYEGPLGTFNGAFQEIGYDKVQEKGIIQLDPATGGWLGVTDKYWLVAFMPEGRNLPFFQAQKDASQPSVQVGFKSAYQLLAPLETLTVQTRLFAGAKILSLLDAYEKKNQLSHFDLAVDFGWFYFLTKPIFYALTWLKGLTGNFGLAILLFTVLLKILFFPLANRSYHAMARMKRVQPMMEQLRARYKDDPARLNQETMEFYKKQKINPVSGCLPMLLQIPAFFALYKVLFISIEMRHSPFLGWIHDLSAPDPTNLFTLFGLIPWNPPSFLHLGLWPLFMGVSMMLQQKLNPPPADPVQRKMFLYVMPAVFTFMLGQFASGLVIYWTWNNILSVLQQWLIMRADLRKTEKLIK